MEVERKAIVKRQRVRACLDQLRERKIHRTFAGYLCVKRTAAEGGRNEDLTVDFKSFFDAFLSVPGGPPNKPYVYAFIEHEPSYETNLWYNANVAGSYSPKSVRKTSPFRKVIEIAGEGSRAQIRYSLREDHWEHARRHLAYGQKIPAVPLAVFLYRNYALRAYPPSVADWVRVFQEEFGYLNQEGEVTEEFKHLYTDESEEEAFEGWFDINHGTVTSS